MIDFGGNLSDVDANGIRGLTYKNLTGTAKLSQLSLQIEDSPLVATEPVSIRFNTREIVFESAHFGGGGSNMTIAGTKALADDAVEDLSINGRVNLALSEPRFQGHGRLFWWFRKRVCSLYRSKAEPLVWSVLPMLKMDL